MLQKSSKEPSMNFIAWFLTEMWSSDQFEEQDNKSPSFNKSSWLLVAPIVKTVDYLDDLSAFRAWLSVNDCLLKRAHTHAYRKIVTSFKLLDQLLSPVFCEDNKCNFVCNFDQATFESSQVRNRLLIIKML